MALSAENAVFSLQPDHNESIFSYNTTQPDETLSDNDYVDFEASSDLNSTLKISENDTLLDVLSKTIIHRPPGAENPTEIAIGVGLAVLCNIIAGFSTVLKKQSLKNLKDEGGTPASQGGFGYLKSKRWWTGFSILLVAEVLGFLSLMFAPAILIASLSVLSIVVAAILSPLMLKEKMGRLARIGCVLVVIGCLIVTLCGPKVQEIASMDELEYYLMSPSFIAYTVTVLIVGSVLMYLAPKYGHKYVFVNAFIVAMFGSLSLFFSKGVGIGIKLTIESDNSFTRWSFWVCVFALVLTLLVELVYTQRSLDVFTIYLLVPVWYVILTSLVILVSTTIFTNNRTSGWKDITLTVAGFLVNAAALYIMMLEKTKSEAQEETPENSADNECPPIQPHLEGGAANKVTGDQHLYEIHRNPDRENLPSAVSKVTSMMMKKPSVPPRALTNQLSAAMRIDSGKTNSCFSLISELPSTSSSKDVSSVDSNVDSSSQTSSSDCKSSDVNSSGDSSDTSPSSSSTSRRRNAGVEALSCDDRTEDDDLQQSADKA